MANIQAALNNMLSSAASGAFLYSQTPDYKRRGEIKELTKQEGILTKESEDLNEEIENPKEGIGGSNRLISVYERSKDLDEELYENQLALHKKTGNKKYLEESFKYSPSQRRNWDELIAEEQRNLFEQTRKQGPVQSITKKTDNARSQLEALIERRDLLSSKERGQLKTMLGRHKNKGEL